MNYKKLSKVTDSSFRDEILEFRDKLVEDIKQGLGGDRVNVNIYKYGSAFKVNAYLEGETDENFPEFEDVSKMYALEPGTRHSSWAYVTHEALRRVLLDSGYTLQDRGSDECYVLCPPAVRQEIARVDRSIAKLAEERKKFEDMLNA